MNKDNVLGYFPIIIGMLLGKDLELQKCTGHWENAEFLDTKWRAEDFRIKGVTDEMRYNLTEVAERIYNTLKKIEEAAPEL